MDPLTRDQMAIALGTLGLQAGDIVMVHSSLSSTGSVEGGADTVVDAFLDVLGSQGTLVVPTFTPRHSPMDPTLVFDPLRDPSGMGSITEVVRTRPAAKRSIHLFHSVAALGPHADEITANHGPSAWAADGPFWKLYDLEARIMMLGVPYLRCTYFHVVEQMVQTPYRLWRDTEAHVRHQDGTLRPLPTRHFGPKPGFQGNDFNKFGALLEERTLVHVGTVGNAVARLFNITDVVRVGVAEYRKDPLLFVMTGETYTPLRDGVMTDEPKNEKSVIDSMLHMTWRQ